MYIFNIKIKCFVGSISVRIQQVWRKMRLESQERSLWIVRGRYPAECARNVSRALSRQCTICQYHWRLQRKSFALRSLKVLKTCWLVKDKRLINVLVSRLIDWFIAQGWLYDIMTNRSYTRGGGPCVHEPRKRLVKK